MWKTGCKYGINAKKRNQLQIRYKDIKDITNIRKNKAHSQ